MLATIVNGYGAITISNNVIACLAGDAAMRCYGVVGMAAKNTKDGFVSLLVKDNATKGIKVDVKDEGLYITMHVILEYGVNIKTTSSSIIEGVKYQIENLTGFTVKEISVNVESVRVE